MVNRVFSSLFPYSLHPSPFKNFRQMSHVVADLYRADQQAKNLMNEPKIPQEAQKNIALIQKSSAASLNAGNTENKVSDQFMSRVFKISVKNTKDMEKQVFQLLSPNIPSVLKSLIESKRFLNCDVIPLFQQLIKEGDFSLAEKIIINYDDLSFPDLAQCISLALAKDAFSFVETAIKTKQLTPDQAGALFKELIERKNTSLAGLVLDSYEISKEDFKAGLFLGIETKQNVWVGSMLKKEEISSEYFEGVFQKLIEEKQIDLAIAFLGDCKLSDSDLLDGLKKALEKNEVELLQKIIETKKLDAPIAGDLFKELIERKQKILAQSVLDNYQLSEKDFEEGLFLAIDSGQTHLAKSFIENPKTKHFPLDGVFPKIIEKQKCELAKILVKNRKISDFDLIAGVAKAFEKEELPFIKHLIEINLLKEIHYREIGKCLVLSESIKDHLEWLYITKIEVKQKAEKAKDKPMMWAAYVSGLLALSGAAAIIINQLQQREIDIPSEIFDRLDQLKDWVSKEI